ncbi:MAG: glucosylceramidase [Tannerellaceae bacterium]|jgi:glucosylceramidase|nr:glucosylceramidase [Tannerellaceae bacterium]
MKRTVRNSFTAAGLVCSLLLPAQLPAQNVREIEAWVTTANRLSLFEKQEKTQSFRGRARGSGFPIIVDERQTFQEIDGFGFAMTEGSAFHLHRMSVPARHRILRELFASDSNHIGISYIRLSLGASDLNNFVYSYNDLPDGETDFELKKFSLGHDWDDIIPVMKEVLAINPHMKILASPWSAPAWMKENRNVRGGALRKDCYEVYARYFVKYVEEMKKAGISIEAVTVQNEPLNYRNTPSMPYLVQEQAEFIKYHLGPAFREAGLSTRIIIFDHNCDRPDYPLTILSDSLISQYVDGSGFHHYGGDISTMSMVHLARPDKNLYFTEQMVVETPGSPDIQIAAQVKRLVIGVMRNWSKNLILWNFAADKLNDPHTNNGGCSMCQGAITIEGDEVSRNLAYYVVAHASKFVPPGSVRIASTDPHDMAVDFTEDEERNEVKRTTLIRQSGVLPNVAFRTPEGKIVLIVANDSWTTHAFRIQYKGLWATIQLAPGSVGTYIW